MNLPSLVGIILKIIALIFFVGFLDDLDFAEVYQLLVVADLYEGDVRVVKDLNVGLDSLEDHQRKLWEFDKGFDGKKFLQN